MEILSITPETVKVVTGRFSDGSDRTVTETTEYIVIVKEEYSTFRNVFSQEPSYEDISVAYSDGLFTDITPPEQPEIPQLKTENLSLKQAIAELGAAAEQDKIEMRLALAELAAIITGGAD